MSHATVTKSRSRILIVDDELGICRALARRVRNELETVIATDGVEALELIEAGHRFEAILCDLMLPRMTGVEFRRQLRRLAPEQADRIVFMTGHTQSVLRAQVNDHFVVEKPFELEALVELLRRVTDASRGGYFPSRAPRRAFGP